MTASEDDLTGLIGRVADAASAFIAGDMVRYAELIEHSGDCTLLAPYGGPARRGFDSSPEALAALARWFQGGEATLEVIETYASGDLAVLVVVERQHGRVGGLPDQDVSLRVTLVFRRTGSGWQQVHRHADPLVHEIDHDTLAALARGGAPAAPARPVTRGRRSPDPGGRG
jgi:ketosteroid isomerase-like protein